MPALPQQISASAGVTSSMPGIACSSARGCGAHALAVRQMAGVVIDDARRDRLRGARGSPSSTSISETSRTLRAERACARAAHCGIVGEELAVLLHRRPAAGGVDHDAIDAGLLEDLDVVPREAPRLLDCPHGAPARRSIPVAAVR